MEQYELLRRVVATLERLHLRYFVTGSMASILYGEPRFTNDIDIVIALPPEKVMELCRAFPVDEFYVSETAALAAVAQQGQFNIIHPTSGLKVDLMVAKDDAFDTSRLARATRVSSNEAANAFYSTPEDLILKKLDFYREGGSEKHLRDIAGIIKVSGGGLDIAYIERWADILNVTSDWRDVLSKASTTGSQE